MLDSKYLQKIFSMMHDSTNDTKIEKDLLIKYKKSICNWMNERQPVKTEYIKILNDNPEELGLIAEIGTGVLDSLVFFIQNNTEHNAIVVSEYANTFGNTKAYNPMMLSDSECKKLDDEIKTVMLQLPCTKRELTTVLGLFNTDKNLYIGSYGLSTDKTKTKNQDYINCLYNTLKTLSKREVKLHEFDDDKYYYSAIEVYTDLQKEEEYIKEDNRKRKVLETPKLTKTINSK